MKVFLFILAVLLLSTASFAVECPPGFVWQRMSGVGCVQEDCAKVGASLSYTSQCFCRDPNKKECREAVNYTTFDHKKCEAFCPVSRVTACIEKNAKCPGEGPTKQECDDYCYSYHNPNSVGTPSGKNCDCKCREGFAPDETLTCKPTAAYCKTLCEKEHGPDSESKVAGDHCDCRCKQGFWPNTPICKPGHKTTTTSTTTTTLGFKTACDSDGKCDDDESMVSCCTDCGCPYNTSCVENKCMFPDKDACKELLAQMPSFLGIRMPTEGWARAQDAQLDLSYDNYMLNKRMFEVIEKYRKDYGNLIVRPLTLYGGANPLEFERLMKHLGSHTMSQDDPEWYRQNFYTGKEAAMRQRISDEYKKRGDRPLDPGDVFKICLELNSGVAYDAMLTCHNFLRGAARGNEKFTGQTLPDGSIFTGKATEEQKRQGIQDPQLTGEGRDPSIFRMLAPMRGTDNEGAWYHLYGTMVAGYAESEEATGGTSSISEQGLSLEHYYVKNSFDAIEYCLDVWGANLGRSIYIRAANPPEDVRVIGPGPEDYEPPTTYTRDSFSSGASGVRGGYYGGPYLK